MEQAPYSDCLPHVLFLCEAGNVIQGDTEVNDFGSMGLQQKKG